uniref:Uncharacterized protein n=1 Tax=Setaria viridis TaxID=4556 RepID=A0A4U6W4S8_SETVI|nr:hypothetical protein SEVIR_1G044050v2 [Setaria viridis]
MGSSPPSAPQNKANEASLSQHETTLGAWDGASKAEASIQSPRPAGDPIVCGGRRRSRPTCGSGAANRPAAAWARVSQRSSVPFDMRRWFVGQ